MKDSTLMLLGGVYLCFLTIGAVLINAPLLMCGVLCFGGTSLVFAAVYEMMVNYN
jgi:hypothetical protein